MQRAVREQALSAEWTTTTEQLPEQRCRQEHQSEAKRRLWESGVFNTIIIIVTPLLFHPGLEAERPHMINGPSFLDKNKLVAVSGTQNTHTSDTLFGTKVLRCI